jgi:hypothetical protein
MKVEDILMVVWFVVMIVLFSVLYVKVGEWICTTVTYLGNYL